MSYTPTNDAVFTAAYSGALAGMGVSGRIPTNTDAADFASLASVAGAYAESFDTEWDDAAAANGLQLSAIEALTEGAWQERSPLASATNLDPDTFTDLCASLIAIITAASDYFSGQGITPAAAGVTGLSADGTTLTDSNPVTVGTGVADTSQYEKRGVATTEDDTVLLVPIEVVMLENHSFTIALIVNACGTDQANQGFFQSKMMLLGTSGAPTGAAATDADPIVVGFATGGATLAIDANNAVISLTPPTGNTGDIRWSYSVFVIDLDSNA